MKTLKKSFLFVVVGIIFFTTNLPGQTTIFNTPFGSPTRDEIWAGTNIEELLGGDSIP